MNSIHKGTILWVKFHPGLLLIELQTTTPKVKKKYLRVNTREMHGKIQRLAVDSLLSKKKPHSGNFTLHLELNHSLTTPNMSSNPRNKKGPPFVLISTVTSNNLYVLCQGEGYLPSSSSSSLTHQRLQFIQEYCGRSMKASKLK